MRTSHAYTCVYEHVCEHMHTSCTLTDDYTCICKYSDNYRRFFKNYPTIAFPLTNLLSKKVKSVWSVQADEAFRKLKQIVVTAPILSTPKYDVSFILYS